MSNIKSIDADKNTNLRFNQTLSNYLKVSVGSDRYNLTNYNKNHLIDVTKIKSPNTGSNLLPKWRNKNLNKNNGAKVGNFYNQPEQTAQQAILEQQVCHRLVRVLCILRQVLIKMEKMYLFLSNEQTSFKLILEHCIITDFQV